MSKVKCNFLTCKWNSPTNTCKYPGTIKLNECFIDTGKKGFEHFLKCKCYEQDESIEEMQKEIIDFFKGK